MLSSTALAAAIQSAVLPGMTSPDVVWDAFKTAFKTYIATNITLTYTWVGVNAGGWPDPQVTFVCQGATWTVDIVRPLYPLGGNDPFNFFATNLQLALCAMLPVLPPNMVVTPLPILMPMPTFKLRQSGLATFPESMLNFCKQVIDPVTSWINPTTGEPGMTTGILNPANASLVPLTGFNSIGGYTGATVKLVIS